MSSSKVKAYLLVTLQEGDADADAVMARLQALPAVVSVEKVTSQYDIICVVEADGLSELGKTVNDSVNSVEGVRKCVSCIVN